MRTLIIYLIILITGVNLLSCSSDDGSDNSNDIIIGKWRAIEQYESGQQVEITNCLSYLYIQYAADGSVYSGVANPDELPTTCGIIDSELDWKWENLGNRKYKIGKINEQGQLFTIYKEGEMLVEEHQNGTTTLKYEPY